MRVDYIYEEKDWNQNRWVFSSAYIHPATQSEMRILLVKSHVHIKSLYGEYIHKIYFMFWSRDFVDFFCWFETNCLNIRIIDRTNINYKSRFSCTWKWKLFLCYLWINWTKYNLFWKHKTPYFSYLRFCTRLLGIPF